MNELKAIQESPMAWNLRVQGHKNSLITTILQFSGICSTAFLTVDLIVGWTAVGTTLTGITLGLFGGSLFEVLRSGHKRKLIGRR